MSKLRLPTKRFFLNPSIRGVGYLFSLTLLYPGFFGHEVLANEIKPTQRPLSLKLEDQLQINPITNDESLIFSSGQVIDGVNDRVIQLKENAEIRRNGSVIKADEISYDLDTDIVNAVGNARINRPNAGFSGPRARLKLDSRQGWIESPIYELKSSRGSGRAERAEFLNEDQTYLTKPTYTTCSPDNVDWYFASKDMLIDEEKDDASGKDGTLYFFDKPILYSPIFSFPLGVERRSGFLTPTFGVNTNTGLDITTPYYLNIAPNRDLTIFPRYMSKRGMQLGGVLRYLEPDYSGIFSAEYLAHDQILGKDRWAYSSKHVQRFDQSLIGYTNINRVSDDFYADDLGRTQGQAITRQFVQEAGLNYSLNGWNYLARVQKYQTLQPITPVLLPYDREPEVNASFRNLDWYGGTAVNFIGNITRFTYNGPLDQVVAGSIPTRGYNTADRMFINTGVSLPFLNPGFYVTPKLSVRANNYNLTGNASYTGLTQSFVIPTASIDSGLFLEREALEMKPIFGRDMLLSIEPRALYVYTPYVDQTQIPLFDTASSGFGIAQIFSENTFVGNDRVADSSKVTTGFTAKILDAETGIERIRGILAQRVDLSGQRVGLLGNQTTNTKYSDLLMGVATRLSGNINLDVANQYNQDLNRSVQTSSTASWRPAPRKMLNSSYRYNFDTNTQKTSIYQYEISGQWPVARSVYAIGRWNYDRVSEKTLNTLIGFEYDQDCWVARVALNKYLNTTKTETTQIFFQIEFKGLSGFGNNPIDIMRLNIPGYVPLSQKPIPLSRFETYE